MNSPMEGAAIVAAGNAVVGILKHAGILEVSIERGPGFALEAHPRDISEVTGKPSTTMAGFGGDPPDVLDPSFDGLEFDIEEWLVFDLVKSHVLTVMAGPLAKQLHAKGRDWNPEIPEESELFMNELDLLDGSRSQKIELRGEWLYETRALLVEHWGIVEQVAKALLETNTIKAEDVETFFPEEVLLSAGVIDAR